MDTLLTDTLLKDHLLTLALITLSIALAIYGLARQYAVAGQIPDTPDDAPLARVSEDLIAQVEMPDRPAVASPAVESDAEAAQIDDFDPAAEAVVLRLPEAEADCCGPEDFATRPALGGTGQEILFRDRILVHLPDVPAERNVDLYIEAIPA